MQNIVELVVSIAVAALLAWSSFRTWRVRSRLLKWGGAGLLALLAVAVALLAVEVLSTSALTALGMIKQHSRSASIPDTIDRELQEIAENLHRSDLTVLERDEQVARWIGLTESKLVVSGTLPETREGRPGIPRSVRLELGIDETDAERAVKVAGIRGSISGAAFVAACG